MLDWLALASADVSDSATVTWTTCTRDISSVVVLSLPEVVVDEDVSVVVAPLLVEVELELLSPATTSPFLF